LSDGYTKLLGSLIHSTIWREADHVRLVWITMLAIVNRDGIVEASVPGLADAARVTLEQCEDALSKLAKPDKYSRSREHDGRRIGDVPGGWRLLNYESYRERMSTEDQRDKAAKRQQRFRQNHPKPRTSPERPPAPAPERNPERGEVPNAERPFDNPAGSDAEPSVTVTCSVTQGNGASRHEYAGNDKAEAEAEAEAEADQEDPAIVERPEDQPAPKRPAKNAAARLVFDAWVAATGRTKQTVFDKKRQARIASRLAEGFTPEQLCSAIANRVNDPFLMGENDRSQVFDGIETLLRDAAQVERLVALTAPKQCGGGRPRRGGPPQPNHGKTGWEGQDQ
jgi:hypothetical protein